MGEGQPYGPRSWHQHTSLPGQTLPTFDAMSYPSQTSPRFAASNLSVQSQDSRPVSTSIDSITDLYASQTRSPTVASRLSPSNSPNLPQSPRFGLHLQASASGPQQSHPASIRPAGPYRTTSDDTQRTTGVSDFTGSSDRPKFLSVYSSPEPAEPSLKSSSRPFSTRSAPDASYEIPPPPSVPQLPWGDSHDASTTLSAGRRHSLAMSPPPRPTSTLSSAGRRLLNRITSIRSSPRDKRFSFIPKSGAYGLVEAPEEYDISDAPRHSTLNTKGGFGYELVKVDDGEEFHGVDISTFEGHTGYQSFSDTKTPNGAMERSRGQMQMQYTLAAEFHQLEAQGKLTGGLGGGMAGATLHIDSTRAGPVAFGSDVPAGSRNATDGITRGKSIRDVGLREARERNEMVVIDEMIPGVDISSLDVSDRPERFSTDESVKDSSASVKDRSKTSYFFPPDATMPNWRPFTMWWPYISLLILLSLGMAGAQEYLYWLSASRREVNDGLLKYKSPMDLTNWDYFCWKYLPTMVAVTYGVLWQVVDFEVKRLEPYYQLSRQEGALAADSLNVDYVMGLPIMAPIKAVKHRHWAVVFCSCAHLIAGSLAPVAQSAALVVIPKQKQRKLDEFKFLTVHSIWARVHATLLVLVAILGCLLLLQLRRKSGLLSDPKGIAGIAAMANKSHILMDFKDLDTATPEEIHHRLKHRRYNLHKSTLWQGEYIKASSSDTFGPNKEGVGPKKVKSPHPIMLRLIGGIPFITFMMLFLTFIPIYLFSSANQMNDHLPWLLTAIATVIRFLWGALEGDVRMMEPFYVLSRRNAPSYILTLDYKGTIPGWIVIKSFLNKHYLLSLVGVGALMTEVLTVSVSSLGVSGWDFISDRGKDDNRANSEETFKSFWVSFTLAIGILLWLCATASLVYYRRRHPFLPREPGTLASVLAFIHQSKMLYSFVDTEKMDSRQMTKHLQRKGKRYGLGWFSGRDGHDHCGVDEEPLLTNYVHGKEYKMAHKPWLGGSLTTEF